MACGMRFVTLPPRARWVPSRGVFSPYTCGCVRHAIPIAACWCTKLHTLSIRIVPDENQPSASIEIALEHSLPDYDLDEVEQPTPRHVDAILVSQGFRDLVDDTRGILMELLAQHHPHHPGFDLSNDAPLVLAQLT